MTKRFAISATNPQSYKAVLALSAVERESQLEGPLLELVKLRASQINGCAFCMAQHMAAARALGVTEGRMRNLAGWRESSLYSPRERAALALAEGWSDGSETPPSEELYDMARRHFPQREIVDLVCAVSVVNGWSRLIVASHGNEN